MDQSTFSEYADSMRRAAEISARTAGCSAEDAQDVASDVMVALWLMIERIDSATCVPYARIAARNKALNHLRHSGHNVSLESDESYLSVAGVSPSPEETYISEEDSKWLIAKIATLPTVQQTILRLRHTEMLERSEIAKLLGITEASVSTLLSRARRAMYNAIKLRMNEEH